MEVLWMAPRLLHFRSLRGWWGFLFFFFLSNNLLPGKKGTLYKFQKGRSLFVCSTRVFSVENYSPLRAGIKRAGWSWLFLHAEHMWLFLKGSRWIPKQNNCTYARSQFITTTIWSFFAIKVHPVCSRFVHVKVIWAHSLWIASPHPHWLKTSTPNLKGTRCSLTAVDCFDIQLVKSCGRKWLLVGPRGAIAILCGRDELPSSDEYTRPILCALTHTLIVPRRTIKSDRNPSLVVFILHRAHFMPCVSPTEEQAFISIPKRPLPPFVSVIYSAVYTHNM